MAIKIVTDSGADIPDSVVKDLDITVVPLTVSFGDETYKDGIDLSSDEFYKKLINDNLMPSTSQPSVGTFCETYRDLKNNDDHILSIHISGKLSGTVNSAVQAVKEESMETMVTVFDSKSASIGLGFSVIAAAQAAKRGESLEQCEAEAQSVLDRTEVFILFETLEYLKRGGRIGNASALLGGILQLKPILTLDDGEIATKLKIRTFRKGLMSLKQLTEECGDLSDAAILYTTDATEANNIANSINNKFVENSAAQIIRISPAVGTHAGPGLVGVICVKAD